MTALRCDLPAIEQPIRAEDDLEENSCNNGDLSRTSRQRRTEELTKAGLDMGAVHSDSIERGLDPEVADRFRKLVELKMKAASVLEEGRVMEHMLKAYAQCHVGDSEVLGVCMHAMASQQDIASQGIFPTINGETGVGKTSSFRAFMHLMPDEVKFEGSASDKAFFYCISRPGMIVFLDDVTLSPELQATIKRAKSNFQKPTQHATVDKMKGVVMTIPERTMFMGGSVQTPGDAQNADRDFNISISLGKDDYAKFDQWSRERAARGDPKMPETEEVRVAREIVRDIKRHRFRVVIPYAPYVKMESETHGKRPTEDFWDFIRAETILNFRQREIIDETDGVTSIVATVADMEAAEKIFDCNKELKKLKLSKEEMKLLNAIRRDRPGEMRRGAVEWRLSEIQDYLKIPRTTLRRRLFGVHTNSQEIMGLCDKLSGIDKVSITEYDGDTAGPQDYERTVVKTSRQCDIVRCTIAATDELGSYTKFYKFEEDGWREDPNYRP